MLSKGLIKLVNSLSLKKYREKHKLFIAEGEKLVNDLIRMGAPVKTVISVRQPDDIPSGIEFIQCHSSELNKISMLKNSPDIIALVKIVENHIELSSLYNKLSLGLDGIQDPGNMGTIIRLANWFGIENILCSEDCVDIFNPKVVQASMGALMGVNIHYTDLPKSTMLLKKNDDYLIYGTYMQGKSIYNTKLQKNALLLMGNEGKGISDKFEKLIDRKISIPSFYQNISAAESLNVGVATGIIVSEFIRQSISE